VKKKSERCLELHHYKFDNLDNHLKIMAIRLTERALLFGGRAEISSSATRFRSAGSRDRVESTARHFVSHMIFMNLVREISGHNK
jgi:hypothetical protein